MVISMSLILFQKQTTFDWTELFYLNFGCIIQISITHHSPALQGKKESDIWNSLLFLFADQNKKFYWNKRMIIRDDDYDDDKNPI